jgi:hypothetical protein
MSVAAVPIVDPLRVAVGEEPHRVGKTPALAEQEQMEVVAKQAPSVHLNAVARHGCGEAVVENLPVVVAAKTGWRPVPRFIGCCHAPS